MFFMSGTAALLLIYPAERKVGHLCWITPVTFIEEDSWLYTADKRSVTLELDLRRARETCWSQRHLNSLYRLHSMRQYHEKVIWGTISVPLRMIYNNGGDSTVTSIFKFVQYVGLWPHAWKTHQSLFNDDNISYAARTWFWFVAWALLMG